MTTKQDIMQWYMKRSVICTHLSNRVVHWNIGRREHVLRTCKSRSWGSSTVLVTEIRLQCCQCTFKVGSTVDIESTNEDGTVSIDVWSA
jgi:hypothetical protein